MILCDSKCVYSVVFYFQYIIISLADGLIFNSRPFLKIEQRQTLLKHELKAETWTQCSINESKMLR